MGIPHYLPVGSSTSYSMWSYFLCRILNKRDFKYFSISIEIWVQIRKCYLVWEPVSLILKSNILFWQTLKQTITMGTSLFEQLWLEHRHNKCKNFEDKSRIKLIRELDMSTYQFLAIMICPSQLCTLNIFVPLLLNVHTPKCGL